MIYHVLAFLTILVWGSTFVSTKVLLDKGLTPSDIFLLRFTLAYVGMALASHKHWRCHNLRDELIMMIAGITGGSMYFFTENMALLYAKTGNVSLIVCLAPLITAILAITQKNRESVSRRLWIGSLLALTGVAFVVNGENGSNSHPLLGHLLALTAAGSWAIYQTIIKPLGKRYGSGMLTRKVFGYGVLTIIPLWWSTLPDSLSNHLGSVLQDSTVIANILYLGLLASWICFWLWSKIIGNLGPVIASNYIYLNPLVTCVVSYFVLDESITLPMCLGGLCILMGVYMAVGMPKPHLKVH